MFRFLTMKTTLTQTLTLHRCSNGDTRPEYNVGKNSRPRKRPWLTKSESKFVKKPASFIDSLIFFFVFVEKNKKLRP
jgi:hypothetical protein